LEDLAMEKERRLKPQLKPHELREIDEKQESHRDSQPYASELADRELEHAQKEKRPTQTNDGSSGNP
jgi:hypothetical protein